LCWPLVSRPASASYARSLHDALPISAAGREPGLPIMTSLEERMNILRRTQLCAVWLLFFFFNCAQATTSPVLETELQHLKFAFRSEEHTSELQSRENLVCRLLLEQKN